MALIKIKRKGEAKQGIAEAEAIAPLPKTELGISKDAASRITALTRAKDDAELYLRVAIRGGGCSGLSLHYELVNDVRNNDIIFTCDDAKVIIDKKSLSLLGGATLHCRDYLGSQEFYLVNNPVEKQCSCGQSFAL